MMPMVAGTSAVSAMIFSTRSSSASCDQVVAEHEQRDVEDPDLQPDCRDCQVRDARVERLDQRHRRQQRKEARRAPRAPPAAPARDRHEEETGVGRDDEEDVLREDPDLSVGVRGDREEPRDRQVGQQQQQRQPPVEEADRERAETDGSANA